MVKYIVIFLLIIFSRVYSLNDTPVIFSGVQLEHFYVEINTAPVIFSGVKFEYFYIETNTAPVLLTGVQLENYYIPFQDNTANIEAIHFEYFLKDSKINFSGFPSIQEKAKKIKSEYGIENKNTTAEILTEMQNIKSDADFKLR